MPCRYIIRRKTTERYPVAWNSVAMREKVSVLTLKALGGLMTGLWALFSWYTKGAMRTRPRL